MFDKSKIQLKENIYLLFKEGQAEQKLIQYFRYNRFADLFNNSKIKFDEKINISRNGIKIIENGNMLGVSDRVHFESKYIDIVEYDDNLYENKQMFFVLDEDIKDSEKIGDFIKSKGKIIQFIKYNIEYLLLELSGIKLKEPNLKDFSDFNNWHNKDWKAYRDYCKVEFKKYFNKEAHEFKDSDFENIFKNHSDEEIKNIFPELFKLIVE